MLPCPATYGNRCPLLPDRTAPDQAISYRGVEEGVESIASLEVPVAVAAITAAPPPAAVTRTHHHRRRDLSDGAIRRRMELSDGVNDANVEFVRLVTSHHEEAIGCGAFATSSRLERPADATERSGAESGGGRFGTSLLVLDSYPPLGRQQADRSPFSRSQPCARVAAMASAVATATRPIAWSHPSVFG